MAKVKKEVVSEMAIAVAENAAVAAEVLDNRDARTAASTDPVAQAYGEEHAVLRRALGESESEAQSLRVEVAGFREKLLDVTAELRRQEREVSKLQAALKAEEELSAAFGAELRAIDDVIGTDALVLIEGRIARPASIRQIQVRQGGQAAGSTHFAFVRDDKRVEAPVVVPVAAPVEGEAVIRLNLSYILGIHPGEDTAVNMAIRCKKRAMG